MIYLTHVWSITIFTVATFVLGLIGIVVYNVNPESVLDGLLGGLAGLFGGTAFVLGLGMLMWIDVDVPKKKTDRLTRRERRNLELEYAERFNDPDYVDYMERHVFK